MTKITGGNGDQHRPLNKGRKHVAPGQGTPGADPSSPVPTFGQTAHSASASPLSADLLFNSQTANAARYDAEIQRMELAFGSFDPEGHIQALSNQLHTAVMLIANAQRVSPIDAALQISDLVMARYFPDL
jgi:hypothetical protein